MNRLHFICGAWLLLAAPGFAAEPATTTPALPTTSAPPAELPPSPWRLAGHADPAIGFLDVLPICMPDAALPEIAGAAKLLREGDLEGARTLLPRAGWFSGRDPVSAVRLAHALLDARAVDRRRIPAAALELEIAGREHPDRDATSCSQLERARLFLRAGLSMEALGAVAIAERYTEADSEPHRVLRAEALTATGRLEEALPIYETLRASPSAAVSWAAALRLTTARPDVEWSMVEPFLDRGTRFVVNLGPLASYAGELALRSGRNADALHWLTRAESDGRHRELAAIRRADALTLAGRTGAAGRLLLRLERTAEGKSAREIASARLAASGTGSEEEQEARLVEAARSHTPGIAAHSLELLLGLYLEADRPEAALDSATRLHHLAPRGGIPGLGSLVDSAVRIAVGGDVDCATVLERLAGGRRLWIRSVSSPDPLLRLGDCALELGLTATAIDVFRALSRRFPDRLSADFALRIATVSLSLGEFQIVEAMLAANERIWARADTPDSERAPWLWLRARASLASGDEARAIAILLGLAASDSTPAPERARSALALAALPPASASRLDLEPRLQAALRLPSDLSPDDRGRIWLRIADLRREAGATQGAAEAYGRAGELLPPGPARARSLHAHAVFGETRDIRLARLNRLLENESAGAWSDLTRGELRLARLQYRLGPDERNSTEGSPNDR
jgi:hypothetical protein